MMYCCNDVIVLMSGRISGPPPACHDQDTDSLTFVSAFNQQH